MKTYRPKDINIENVAYKINKKVAEKIECQRKKSYL